MGENVIKIGIIWRAGDANDASIQRWRCAVGIGVEGGIQNEVEVVCSGGGS